LLTKKNIVVMKKQTLAFFTAIMLVFLASCKSDAPATTDVTSEDSATTTEVVQASTTMAVDRMEHDFGNISDVGGNVETTFTITNTGNNPLLISEAKGSCGCTVPDYPRDPIQPGESREILVSFDPAGKEGAQNKTVTIMANTEPATTVINLRSNIVKQ
jgi:hypothetical protein